MLFPEIRILQPDMNTNALRRPQVMEKRASGQGRKIGVPELGSLMQNKKIVDGMAEFWCALLPSFPVCTVVPVTRLIRLAEGCIVLADYCSESPRA